MQYPYAYERKVVVVHGDLLNLLVIVKLPFLPPTHPLLEAKVERVQEAGENAFEKVTLPGAVIRFKQGFGRLIRRSSDKGVVIVLDGRVTSKKYGLTFLRSLPIKTFYTASKEDVIAKVLNWLNG
jgi:ATP-dependent DNA helicase DinG